MATALSRPAAAEHKPAYRRYIDLVPEGDLIQLLAEQLAATTAFLAKVPAAKEQYRYAPEKWTVTQVAGHVADAERVFAYRILRFARQDKTEVPGFDENAWTVGANYERRKLKEVAAEWAAVRQGTIALLKGLDSDAFTRVGTANGSEITVRALAYVIAGHERHHVGILKERYGV